MSAYKVVIREGFWKGQQTSWIARGYRDDEEIFALTDYYDVKNARSFGREMLVHDMKSDMFPDGLKDKADLEIWLKALESIEVVELDWRQCIVEARDNARAAKARRAK